MNDEQLQIDEGIYSITTQRDGKLAAKAQASAKEKTKESRKLTAEKDAAHSWVTGNSSIVSPGSSYQKQLSEAKLAVDKVLISPTNIYFKHFNFQTKNYSFDSS